MDQNPKKATSMSTMCKVRSGVKFHLRCYVIRLNRLLIIGFAIASIWVAEFSAKRIVSKRVCQGPRLATVDLSSQDGAMRRDLISEVMREMGRKGGKAAGGKGGKKPWLLSPQSREKSLRGKPQRVDGPKQRRKTKSPKVQDSRKLLLELALTSQGLRSLA